MTGRGAGWRTGRCVALARDLANVVLPVECPGCGALDVRLCAACAEPWSTGARRVEHQAARLDRLDGSPVLPVWGLTAYVGPARGVVVAWKDRGRADLTRELGAAMRSAARGLAPALARALGPSPGGASVQVVPAPSTWSARQSRGREPVRELAVAVAAGLQDGGVPARLVPALRGSARARDQVGLGARGRAANRRGAVVVRGSPRPGAAGVLLVDDVLTTGATLAGCEDALRAAGAAVVGAMVLAATPPPSVEPPATLREATDQTTSR